VDRLLDGLTAMTEAEWLNYTDPQEMLEAVPGMASDRKLLLFAVACCRRIGHLLEDKRCRKAVEIAETAADRDRKSRGDLARIEKLVTVAQGDHEFGDATSDNALCAVEYLRWGGDAAGWAAEKAAEAMAFDREDDDGPTWDEARADEQVIQCHLLRCILGHPSRPVTLDPAWLTPTVTGLAEAIYRERAFERMPALADALRGAGCKRRDILGHCRQPGEHVRGCWVVDLILKKE
jgi:hypothetical protein